MENLEISNAVVESVLESVKKKATGYLAEEVVEEYTFNEELNKDVLVKKKVSKMEVPADITAAKFLIDLAYAGGGKDYENLSDEQIDEEIERLICEYRNISNSKNIESKAD